MGVLAAGALVASLAIPGPVARATDQVMVADSFARDLSGTWGTAPTGGAYVLNGRPSAFAVESARGAIDLASEESRFGAIVPGAQMSDTQLVFKVAVDHLPETADLVIMAVVRRASAGNEYRGRVLVAPTGAVAVQIVRMAAGRRTALTGITPVRGLTVAPGMQLRIRFDAMGAHPTRLRLRVWPAGTPEPLVQASTSDATSAMQPGGAVGVRVYAAPDLFAATGPAGGRAVVRFDDLKGRGKPKRPEPTPTPEATPRPTPAPTPDPTPRPTPTPTPRPTATPAPTPRPDPTPPPAGDPIALGAFIPGAPSDPSLIDAFAQKAGAMPAIVMWYQLWSGQWNEFHAPGADAVRARGAMPMISWEPWRGQADDPAWSLDAISRGDHDGYIRDWASDVAAWGHPILIRPMHEMNGGWTSWGVVSNGNTPADFIDAWRHIVATARDAGADNIRWVWCPNTLLSNGVTYSSIYPGDAHVDWLCLDGYNWGTTQSWSSWESMRTVFLRSVDALAALSDKPIMIGETGSTEQGGDKARWILNGFAMLPTEMPRVEAVVWFNKAQDGADWPIDTSVASRDAYRTISGWAAYQGDAR